MANRPGLWLVVAAFVVYTLNFGYGACGSDDMVFRYLPSAILEHGTLTMDPYTEAFTDDGVLHYSVVEHDGHLVPIYPPATGILALPVFAVPVLLGGGALPGFLAGKIAATAMAALSVGLVYGAIRRLGLTTGQGLLLAGIYAFGTPVHSTASKALCQHPAATLGVAAALYCGVRGRDEGGRWAVLAGLAAGVAIAVRPQTALAVVPVCGVLLLRARGWRGWAVAAGAAPVGLALAYNLLAAGDVFGGYALVQQRFPEANLRGDVLVGAAGIVLSPGRGLLPFVPVAIFAVPGLIRGIRRRAPLVVAAAIGIAATVLLFSRLSTWWAGHAYGPRYLTEVMPLLVLLLVPLFRPPSLLSRRRWAIAFGVLAAASLFVHVVGAFGYPCSWDEQPVSVNDRPVARSWNPTDTPVTRCLGDGLGFGHLGPF